MLGTLLQPDVNLKILWKQTTPKEKKPTTAKSSQTQLSSRVAAELEAPEFKKQVGTSKKPAAASSFNLNDGLPMNISIEELEATMKHATTSVAERSTILDARDRYIRLKREVKVETTNVKSAVLKGTCYDMCPEKERYSRAEKRRLASYELLAGHEKVQA